MIDGLEPAERYFYDRGQYGRVAALVDACMAHRSRKCKGPPVDDDYPADCDQDALCWRHSRTPEVVGRLAALRGRQGKRL